MMRLCGKIAIASFRTLEFAKFKQNSKLRIRHVVKQYSCSEEVFRSFSGGTVAAAASQSSRPAPGVHGRCVPQLRSQSSLRWKPEAGPLATGPASGFHLSELWLLLRRCELGSSFGYCGTTVMVDSERFGLGAGLGRLAPPRRTC